MRIECRGVYYYPYDYVFTVHEWGEGRRIQPLRKKKFLKMKKGEEQRKWGGDS